MAAVTQFWAGALPRHRGGGGEQLECGALDAGSLLPPCVTLELSLTCTMRAVVYFPCSSGPQPFCHQGQVLL